MEQPMRTMSSHENAILAGVRALMADGIYVARSNFYADAAQYLTTGTRSLGRPILPGMTEHAREVLIRLSKLAAHTELHRPMYLPADHEIRARAIAGARDLIQRRDRVSPAEAETIAGEEFDRWLDDLKDSYHDMGFSEAHPSDDW